MSCNLAPEVSAHEIRIRNNAYSAEVKSVRVPASGKLSLLFAGVMLGFLLGQPLFGNLQWCLRDLLDRRSAGFGHELRLNIR
jgi:hypothetical protein